LLLIVDCLLVIISFVNLLCERTFAVTSSQTIWRTRCNTGNTVITRGLEALPRFALQEKRKTESASFCIAFENYFDR
jgi:hypothetical protein